LRLRGLRSVNFSEGSLMAAGMEILALQGGEDVNLQSLTCRAAAPS